MASMFNTPQILAGVVTDHTRASNPDGQPAAGGLDKNGAILVAQAHGRYSPTSVRGGTGFSTTISRATSLAATSQVGNIIYNPVGSGVNLALTKWSVIVKATSATMTGMQLAYTNQSTAPTGLTVADAWGKTVFQPGTTATTAFAPSKGLGYAAATLLVAPLPFYTLFQNTAAINTVGVYETNGDLEGAFIIPPGGVVALCAVGAAAASSAVDSTLMWEEIPV